MKNMLTVHTYTLFVIVFDLSDITVNVLTWSITKCTYIWYLQAFSCQLFLLHALHCCSALCHPLSSSLSSAHIRLSFTHWLPVDLWGAHFKIRNGSFTQLVILSVTFLPSVPSIKHPSSLSCSFWLHSFHPSAHVSIIPFSSLPVLCPRGTCNLSLPPSGLLPCISHSLSSLLAFHILQLPRFLLALPQR